MVVHDLSELDAAARQRVETYLTAVTVAVRQSDPDVADSVLEDLRDDLFAALSGDSTADDVERAIARYGDPSSIGSASEKSEDLTEPVGRFLGMPYDYRVTGERAMSRIWNPQDPRIIMPRLFGLGWTVNFGAIAVKLHLIEPDAEDEPFGSVSERAFLLALFVPVALTAFVLGSYLALRTQLPAMLPSHWNAAGVVDGYATQLAAFLLPFGFASTSTLVAMWAVAAKRSAFVRGGYIGLASGLSALGAGIWALTLASALRPPVNASMPALMILPTVIVPFAVLLGLSRAGRGAEQRRDLVNRRGATHV